MAEKFIRSWRIKFDVIFLCRRPERVVQPLHQSVDELSRRFNVPVVKAVSKKAADTTELKNLREYHERQAVLPEQLSSSHSL